MKKTGFMALLSIFVAGSAVAKPDPVVQNSNRGLCPVTHRFLKGGWASQGVAIIGADLQTEWGMPSGEEISDTWGLKDGGIVHSYSVRRKEAGIKRYTADKKLKWVYTSATGRDNHNCQPLPGGRFLAAETEAGRAFMVEVNDQGRKCSELELELTGVLTAKDKFHMFRNVRKTPEGTYLAACMKANKAVEWDASGKFLREFPDCHYTAIRLPNGNTLVSGKRGVLEYDNNGKEVWAMKAADFTKLNLRMLMICGIQRLPNGNTIISNVNHGAVTKTGDFYKLVEVTREKELVWWVDPAPFDGVNMGSFQMLDVAGDPAAFEVWK